MATSRKRRARARNAGADKPARSTKQARQLYEAGIFNPILNQLRPFLARTKAVRNVPDQLPTKKKRKGG